MAEVVRFYFDFILTAAVLVLLHHELLAFQSPSEYTRLLTWCVSLTQDFVFLLNPLHVVVERVRNDGWPLRAQLAFTLRLQGVHGMRHDVLLHVHAWLIYNKI